DERLLEPQEAAADVAEMYVEDFPARAKVADDVVDLLSRLLEHLADGALAEVQPVIPARRNGDEALQAFNAAQYGLDASKTLATRHARILRVARHPDLVFLGHRNHALEEVRDALPVRVRA